MSEHMDLLRRLRERRIELWLAGDRICYRATKSAITPEEIAALRRMKHDIAAMLRHGLASTTDSQVLTERSSGLAPITLQQKWIWNAIQLGAACYLDTAALRLQGTLDHQFMQTALERLLCRHDSLRTTIVTIDGTPHQRIMDSRPFHLELIDIAHLPLSEHDEIVKKIGQQLSNQQCDLAVGPLFDVRLLRLNEQSHVLMWAIHHIIADAFSIGLIFQEFWLIYEQISRCQSLGIPPASLQYPEYAFWQRSLHHENDSYWSARLDGASGARWPSWVFSEASENSFNRVAIPVAFGREASDRLRKIAADAGTTLAMSALTIYIAVLLRWCGQRDLTVAVTVTGRDRPDLEKMIGYCAHALYIRIRLSDNDSFNALQRQVTSDFYGALSHQDFGRAVADSPQLFSRALFQWSPWLSGNLAQLSIPTNAGNMGLEAEPWPTQIKLKKRGVFSQYAIFSILCESEEGVVGRIFSQQSAASAMMMFTRDLRNTAEQLALTPNAPLTAYLSRSE